MSSDRMGRGVSRLWILAGVGALLAAQDSRLEALMARAYAGEAPAVAQLVELFAGEGRAKLSTPDLKRLRQTLLEVSPRSLPFLFEVLPLNRANSYFLVAGLLEEIRSPEAVPPFLAILEGREPVRGMEAGGPRERAMARAAQALGELGDGRGREPLERARRSGSPLLRLEAARALWRLGDSTAASLEELTPYARDAQKAAVRSRAVAILVEIHGLKALPLLREVCLQDPEAQVRQAAAASLRDHPSVATSQLLREIIATETAPGVLETSLRTLVDHEGVGALPELEAVLNRGYEFRNPLTRAFTLFIANDLAYRQEVLTMKLRLVELVARLPGPAAGDLLAQLARQHKQAELRQAARRALDQRAGAPPLPPSR